MLQAETCAAAPGGQVSVCHVFAPLGRMTGERTGYREEENPQRNRAAFPMQAERKLGGRSSRLEECFISPTWKEATPLFRVILRNNRRLCGRSTVRLRSALAVIGSYTGKAKS